MKKLTMICTMTILCLAAGNALADISNGSFEDGLNNWSYTLSGGNVDYVPSHSGGSQGTTSWLPQDGSYFARLGGGNADTPVQLYQTFTASAGDSLTFDYFWNSMDGEGYNDTGKGSILSGSIAEGSLLDTLFLRQSSTDPYDWGWGTPWTSVSYNVTSAGTFTLLIETWNGGDNLVQSYVGIDNVAINPVPIPGAFLLGILGLGAAGLKLRRFV